MGTTSLLDLDIKRILSNAETLTGIRLPTEVIEVSLVPGEDILHVRFKEPSETEFGEPVHPLIHLFRDAKTEDVTAIEVVEVMKLETLTKSKGHSASPP
ncbi:MAG: hypothetical protein H3Z53_01675 [archaeon]|nr:hypothetical protein [archaeon]